MIYYNYIDIEMPYLIGMIGSIGLLFFASVRRMLPYARH